MLKSQLFERFYKKRIMILFFFSNFAHKIHTLKFKIINVLSTQKNVYEENCITI